MTNEQINAAIAEATDADPHWKCAKNYCNDLNAMHEAEKMLDFNQLRDMEDSVSFRFAVLPFHATAAQRAEAFLRTLGKWDQSGDATEMVKEVQK